LNSPDFASSWQRVFTELWPLDYKSEKFEVGFLTPARGLVSGTSIEKAWRHADWHEEFVRASGKAVFQLHFFDELAGPRYGRNESAERGSTT